MKQNNNILFSIFAGLLLMISTGCTRNNGDIGNWFGTWQIMEITTDGTPDADYNQQFFLGFQNNIVKLIWVAPNGYERETYSRFGTWLQPSDEQMEFDFTHSDDSGTGTYRPFTTTHFPNDKPFTMTITNSTGNSCTMTYFDESTSKQYTYELRKR